MQNSTYDNNTTECEVVSIYMTKCDIDEMLDVVLNREKNIYKKYNNSTNKLLNRLWEEASDVHKLEILNNKETRKQLDYWSISYDKRLVDIIK